MGPVLPRPHPDVRVGQDEERIDPARPAEGRRHRQADALQHGAPQPATQPRSASQPAATSAPVKPQWLGAASTTTPTVRLEAGTTCA